MTTTTEKPTVATFESELQKPDALEQLAAYVYRYRSSAFNSKDAGMTQSQAKRTAEILIRTRLMPTLNGGAIAQAFEVAEKSAR